MWCSHTFYLSASSLSCRARLLTTARSKAAGSNRRSTFRIPLSNVDRREKDADARRWLRGINNRRRCINRRYSVPMGIGPILAIVVPPAIFLKTAIVVPALLLWPPPFIIIAERRPRGYTADHRSEDERHQNLTEY